MDAGVDGQADNKGNIIPKIIDKTRGNNKLYIGERLTDFEIIQKLGKGQFGQVYLVKSKITKKCYAVKHLKLENENQMKDI